MNERRTANRLDDSELSVDVLPNAAGGVIAKVLHRPSRRFASAHHRDSEQAVREAKRRLTRELARLRRRQQKGLSVAYQQTTPSAVPREILMQRVDRPSEVWKAQLVEGVWRCGVCLEGTMKLEPGASCAKCGATITKIFLRNGEVLDQAQA